MQLEFKYQLYISELHKKNMFIWMFRGMYKRKLRKRLELGDLSAFWKETILKVV